MEVFESTYKVYLKNDIEFSKSFETLSKFISYTLVRGGLEESHNKRGFKHYVFSGFRQKNGESIYRAGEIYEFSIRSLDENLITLLSNELRKNINNPSLIALEVKTKVQKKLFISELYSLTPVIISTENNQFWTMHNSGDIMQLQRQLHDNLEKKYQNFFSEELKATHNFIQLLEIKNQKPQNIVIYKDGKRVTFFGNKFKIVPNEDELSQKLAFVALACGLGEKNSYGGGFCLEK